MHFLVNGGKTSFNLGAKASVSYEPLEFCSKFKVPYVFCKKRFLTAEHINLKIPLSF